MAIIVEEVPSTRIQVVAYRCDKCGMEYTNEMYTQEFFHINQQGGYSSIVGDGAIIRCDLCQDCAVEVLGPYWVVE